MTTLASWEVIALVFSVLWIFWRFLEWVFDVIEKARKGEME